MPMMKPLSPCRSPRCPNRGPGYSPTCQGLVANRLLGPIHGRGVWLFGKWRDVVDQVRAFSAHGPDVPALGTAVVVSARQFARERQKPARRTVTRWTVRDRGHGWGTAHYPSEMAVRAIRESPYRNECLYSKRSETPPLLGKDLALMIRADTTAPVVNDEEKLARATTQAHKAARDGYRFDVGTFAIWAGCDRATTLVAGAQHVGVLRLLFARWLRLRTKWRDVMDQLRVVLVHAPDVSARTAIVRESRVLARERQIFGGILPTRRTGRSVEQLIVSRTERTSSPTSDLRHVARRLDSFVSRSRGKRSLSSAVEDYRRSRPVDRTYTCQGWVWRTRSDFVLCGFGDSGRGVRLKLAGLAEARCASSPPRVEGAVALD